MESIAERSPAYDDPSNWKRFAKDDQPKDWDDLDADQQLAIVRDWIEDEGLELAEIMLLKPGRKQDDRMARMAWWFQCYAQERCEKLAE